jgi:hypothetical protein
LDGGSTLKYFASEEFEFGSPKFTDGLDMVNASPVLVKNVEPEIVLNATGPKVVDEQAVFLYHVEFTDPAAGVPTEIFQYNITWGNGEYSGWSTVTQFKPGRPGGETKLTLQPGTEGKDSQVYIGSPNGNQGTYMRLMTNYGVNTRGFCEFDLSSVSSSAEIISATMSFFHHQNANSGNSLELREVKEPWGEMTVTWNNQPSVSSTQIDTAVMATQGEWLDFNVTDLVKDWVNYTKPNYGVRISGINGVYNSAYIMSSDAANPYSSYGKVWPKLVIEFAEPLPPLLPRGIIEEPYSYPDDHPVTGTPSDMFDITIDLKDDDLGTDYAETNITVRSVPPEVFEGVITPDLSEGIDEGTYVTISEFTYDDVAFDEPTETFEYQIDWGDGTSTPWMDDFRYTGPIGPGTGGSGGTGGGYLETIFAQNNGQSGNMFDVKVKSDIIIDKFDINILAGTHTMEVYYKKGSYVGFETNAAAWTKLGTTIVTGLGSNLRTPCPIGGLEMRAGESYGLYVTCATSTSIRYTNGANTYNNADLTITTGVGKSYPFGSTFTPRTWNGRIYYSYAAGNMIKDNVIENSSQFSNGRKMVMDSDDNVYAIYMNGLNPTQIFISNSSDLGEVWTENQVTTGTTMQLDPSLAIDSSGVLHAVWRGDVSGVYQIRYANSANGGVTWGNFNTITSETTDQSAPSIAVDTNDKVHISWFGTDSTSSTNIYYVNRTSIGTWGIIATVASSYNEYPSIATDSEDNVHIVWSGRTTTSTTGNIKYSMLDASTGSWSTIKMLSSSTTNDQVSPSIAVDLDDNINVVWTSESSASQIQYIRWDAKTTSWGSAEEISTNKSANDNHPSIGVDHRGYAYVVWYKDNPDQLIMMMSNGNLWFGEFELTRAGKINFTTYPNVLYGSESCIIARGLMYLFTAENETARNLYWGNSADFNLTDFGPWIGIPGFKHIYRDDNPSGTDLDVYNLSVRVRDDDLAVGAYINAFEINNVWPEMDKGGIPLTMVGDENALYTPEIPFTDPGTGPTETWYYWLDVDDSETWTANDLTGPVTTTTVINDVTHGTIPPILMPYNDDYEGTIGLYLYDDDVESSKAFINFSYKITGDGEIYTVKQNSLSSSTNPSGARNLAMDSKGNLYAVYGSYPSPYKIFVAVSADMGNTWKEYQVSTESMFSSYYQYYPSIAIDSNDVIHVAWRGQMSGYSGYRIVYKNSKDGGKTWGNRRITPTATSGTHYMYSAAIAVDSKDTVHIVAYGRSSSTSTAYYNIHYVNRTSTGTWSALTLVTTDTVNRYHYYPSIAIDTKDNVHVAWNGRTATSTSYYQLQYRMKSGATGAWGTKQVLTSASYYQYYACIVTDLNDNVHIAWHGDSPYKMKYIRYNASSSSWDSIETVVQETYNYYPSISVDQRGFVYVAWYGGTTSPYKIRLSRKTNPVGTWSTPITMSDAPQLANGYQYYPSLMGHGPDEYPLNGAAMVWSGYTGSSYDTHFTTTDDFWTGQTFEATGNKIKFSVQANNAKPDIICPNEVIFMPDEDTKLPVQLADMGSDDLYFQLDWGDGSTPTRAWSPIRKFYNNDVSPEPVYPPTHSALNGTAPFEVDPGESHTYYNSGTYTVNMTAWDDDMWMNKEPGVNMQITARVLTPYEIKEKTVEILEKILPGRLEYIGYETLELRYLGEDNGTVMVYNNINRPPYYWETEFMVTFCNLTQGDTFLIDGTYLDEGMLGDKIILKFYDDYHNLLDVTEINTVYTCLEPLEVDQVYGPYQVVSFNRHEGDSYHHYSQFAVKTEDALDHILRSINRDPRRGYGYWHQYWAWWCGFTYYRGLWVDQMHLDPDFGTVVFVEEKAAVLDLMEVLKNCIDPKGVIDLTFEYNGGVMLRLMLKRTS